MSWDVGSRNRLNKRVKIASLKSNESNGTVKRSRKIRGDGENGGIKNFKSSSAKDKRISMGREGSEGMSDVKRQFSGKRVYADRETRVDARSRGKDFSGKRHGPEGDSGVVKVKDRSVASRTMWGSAKLEGANSEDKPFPRKVKSVVRSDRVSGVTRGKAVDGGETGLLKKRSTSKPDSSKGLDVSKRKSPALSPSSSSRRKIQDKKSIGEDLGDAKERPKKKKRVIRIDPYDISNKRLDDGIVNNEVKEEKKQDLEERTEMSKNAQFRAIQPSPSILSYVEDNLLGRRRLIELRRAGYNTEFSAPLDNIPHSTSSERERIEENVFRNKLTFFAAAKVSSSFPPPELPEIAFAGRSNVGKSSLLNALTRQWGVVRTSDKPGLTQSINFFNLGSKLCLVDLPGYGFAYAKEEVKDAWEELVKEYVSTRAGLKRVCLLIDTKWGMKPRDHELIDLMERAQTKYQIVLTKTDVVFPIDVARRAMQIEESLKAHKSVVQPVVMVSSQSGAGIRSLRTVLAKLGRFAKF